MAIMVKDLKLFYVIQDYDINIIMLTLHYIVKY